MVSEAVVQSPEEIVSGESVAQFLADHRDGARFGVAVANPSNQPILVVVAVFDSAGQAIGNTAVDLHANDFRAFFVDELVTIPTGHTGQVVIAASGSFYAIGLRFTGLVFTTNPATVTATPDTPEPQQFSFSGTWTGPYHQQFSRDTSWHGDHHDHSNWFVPFLVRGLRSILIQRSIIPGLLVEQRAECHFQERSHRPTRPLAHTPSTRR